MTGRGFFLAFAAAAAGCGGPPTEPADTGSRAAAKAFFAAVARKDWAAARDLLPPADRAAVTADRFARLGEAYRQRFGFDPTDVRVPACDEDGDAATAHVVVTGRGHGRHRWKDAVRLRKDGAAWYVLPPAGFGR